MDLDEFDSRLDAKDAELDPAEYETYFELDSDEYRLYEEWRDIVEASETNVVLKDLLSKVKMVYNLVKIQELNSYASG